MAHFQEGFPARRVVIDKLADVVDLELLAWRERIAADLGEEAREEFLAAFSDMSKMAVIKALTLQEVRKQKEVKE